MIKTLKITILFAAVLALVFLGLSIALGLRPDQEKENFLMKPGSIEQYRKNSNTAAKKTDEISPLMKQAKDFALRIQPPAPEKPKIPTRPTIVRPTKVTPKFTLIGTAVYDVDPIRSLALIDEPGKGLRWVKQSQTVGHLVIDQVNDGNIVIRDGERLETLYIIKPEKQSLLKSPPDFGPQRDLEPAQTKALHSGMISPEKRSRSMRPRRRPGRPTNESRPNTPPEQMPDSMGISPEEAEDLGQIGTLLQQMEEEIMRMEREKQNAQAVSAPNEPNSR